MLLVVISIFAYGQIGQDKYIIKSKLLYANYIIDGQEAYILDKGEMSREAYHLFFVSDNNSLISNYKYDELKSVEVFMKNDLRDRNHYVVFTPKIGTPETVPIIDYIVFRREDLSRRTDKFISLELTSKFKRVKISDKIQLAKMK